jgi:CheY-like chemotaxis protein
VKRVLFADDDALVSRIYSEKLSQEGFQVVVAEDGVAATRQLMEFRPDVVVLDLLMPRLNGADVLKFIRARPELKSTRVIIFSNSFLAALVEQVGSLGVEGVLPKSSATPSRLIEMIHRALDADAAAAPKPAPLRDQPPVTQSAPRPEAKQDPVAVRTAEKSDEQFRSRVQQEFVEHVPGVVAEIRQLSRGLLEASSPAAELQRVEELSRKVGFLTQMASMAGCAELTQLSSALELLFFHLQEKAAPVEDSCRNTIADAVAFLTQHLEQFPSSEGQGQPLARVLVVDDDQVSNRGIMHALTHANFHPTTVTDPIQALEKLRQTPYGLVILDIELPGMDGVALCEEIRRLDLHRHTPIVFLTGHGDSNTRALATLSGGNDFISKPILPIELTVKVITQYLKSRLK